MNRQLVAFAGRKGCGKDTAGLVLKTEHFEHASFIRPGKKMLRNLLAYRGARHDEIERMIDGDLKEIPSPYLSGATPRKAMQTLGYDWARLCLSSSFWLDTLVDWMAVMDRDQEYNWYLTDCRFLNEADFLKDRGWTIIKIDRPGLIKTDGHATEESVDYVKGDLHITNDFNSADEFKAAVRELLVSKGIITT